MSTESKSKKILDLTSNNLRKLSSTSMKKSCIPLKKITSEDSGRKRAERRIGGCKNVNYSSKSQDCLVNPSNMTYIPFDVLLSVVLAEKDAYIKDLMEKLSKCDSELHRNFSGLEGYNLNDVKAIIRKDAEVIALKNKIASLQAELEEQKSNISDKKLDLILDENDSLKIKLKNTEEILQELMKSKKNLEESRNKELNNYDFQENTISIAKNELFQHKNEEITRLNIQLENKSDFNQQTEESSVISERDYEKNDLYSDYLDEIKCLREENSRMKERIDDLLWYEKQYDKLRDKLCECEMAVKSLTNDNRKLMNKIKKLEEQIASNQTVGHDKSENESFGKELVLDERYCHVKTDDENEIQRLRMKIKFLSSKLQKSSGELEEEINRVQSLQKEVNEDWNPKSTSVSIQTENESTFEDNNSHLLKDHFDPVFEIQDQISSFVNAYERKEAMSYKEVQNFLESSKKIIAFVLENMIEYQKEMEELKIHNRIMKDELEELKTDLSQTDVDELLHRIDKLNVLAEEKTREVENLSKCRKEEWNSNRKEVDDLKDSMRMLKMLLGDVKQENLVLNQGLELKNRENGGLKKKLEKYENDLKNLKEQRGNLEIQLAKLIGEINKMDDVISNQKDAINKQREELVKLKEVEVVSRSLTSKRDSQEIIEMPKIDYEKFLNEKNALESALHHLGKEFSELKKELEGMKRLKNETIRLKCERDGLLEKIARSEIEIEDLKAKFSECSTLKNQLAKLKPIESALGKKIARLSALNSQKESAKTREILNQNEKLINEINEVKSENDKLKNILEDLKKNLEERKKRKELKSPPLSGDKTASNKIKTLMRQHDKEMKARDKIFNEALNSMKSNYECDVRKLIERHKGSILKLQNLHEDEIQELNTNYETQMEQLQTQHEKILNDLKLESGEKIKRVTEQRNHDMKDLESKFRRVLHEKETEHMFQISKLQLKITENDILVDDLNLKKKLRKTNSKRLEMMTTKYDEELSKKGKNRAESDFKPVGKNWPEIFQDSGIYIDPFTFDLDCSAQGNITTRENYEHCHPSPAKSSKEEMLNKIIILENKMEFNRMEMQEAVANVEKVSARRLKELENLLNEQEKKNSELQALLADHHSEKKKFDDEVMEKNKEIEKQKAEKKFLEEELLKQNDKIKSLKEKFKNQRRKDLEYIESMRLRLEQELDSERR